MSEMLRCDRCGRADELPSYSFGYEAFYAGKVMIYQCYGDEAMPAFEAVDLCKDCRSILDQFVMEFMEEVSNDRT